MFDYLKNSLQEIGLPKNEADIYLALLPLGRATASILSYRTGMSRHAARYHCRQLAKKKLLQEKKQGNTFFYTVEPPEKIFFMLEEEKNKIVEKEEQVNRIISQLKGIVNPNTILPKARFYVGLEGLQHIYEDTIQKKYTIYAFENVAVMAPKVKDYIFNNYLSLRIKNKIFAKVITPKNKANEGFRKEDEASFRETKFLPQEIFPMEVEINIYGDKTALFSYKEEEMFGIIIESSAIAKSMKSLFDVCWEQAK